MQQTHKKILLSGVKPTGRPHIGNYFGAMEQFVELQNEYQSYIFIPDLHALNSVQNAIEMRRNIIDVALDYLAIGLDPSKVTIFKQSDVPAHTELSWIFDTITTMSYLMRSHAYKDAEAKNKEINVGTFNYPMLMAADILLYDTDVVPVGQDQKQHIEITRDTAEKFNRIFGDTFKLPAPLILESTKVVPGTDGKKMSKSYNNTIPLFAGDELIRKLVMSIPTDSKSIDEPKNPDEDMIFTLHRLFMTGVALEDIRDRYIHGSISYKESKEILVKNISNFTKPMRERRIELEKDIDYVLDVIAEGGKKAKVVADKKMEDVRKKIGVTL